MRKKIIEKKNMMIFLARDKGTSEIEQLATIQLTVYKINNHMIIFLKTVFERTKTEKEALILASEMGQFKLPHNFVNVDSARIENVKMENKACC